jgi:sulfite reductase (NADPH) flavoprotein alpha-component
MNPPPVPFLPESAPFTAEQRAYLNGFLAGLFSRVPGPAATAAPAPAPPRLIPLSVCFGSQTGTAEGLAKRVAREASKRGFAPTLHDLASVTPASLSGEHSLLVVTSTYGDGEPPDNAKALWKALSAGDAPRLEKLRFAVCGIGDSSYARFCGFARDLDARLAALGATRVVGRADCDTDPEETFLRWLSTALTALQPAKDTGPEPSTTTTAATASAAVEPSGHSRSNPFPSRLVANRRLNAPGSAKDVRHLEFDLAGSGLAYEAGDALGVVPRNDPALVSELLRILDAPPDARVALPGVGEIPLSEALLTRLEITRIPRPLLEHVATASGDATLLAVAAPDANGVLTRFLYGREIVDLLVAHPDARPDPQRFVGMLRKLAPRLYSISSSPKAHPGQVHLTVGTVRYESLGRPRSGVCSTFLADRVGPDATVPVFVHVNRSFRPPPPDRPLIMVGPGTGIAPFRAFLEERRAVGATGRNWLFFGDQRSATDFLYREELEGFQRDGVLHRLDLAWSRDGADKVYVQDLMRRNAAELHRWLEEGAAFCVCGDASRMAKDVDAALQEIYRTSGGLGPEEASARVDALKAEKRYLRDVY